MNKNSVFLNQYLNRRHSNSYYVSTDKPGPPAAFDVSEITNVSCLLTWNPPRDDGGSKITNYVVEKREGDSEIWHKLSSTIKETNFNVTNLKPLKEYIFRVSAENMYGVGEPALSSPIIAKYSFGKSIHLTERPLASLSGSVLEAASTEL